MRIRITAVTGLADGRGTRYAHRAEVEVPDQLGRAWINAGHAEPVDPVEEPTRTKRTATAPPARTRPKSKTKAADDT